MDISRDNFWQLLPEVLKSIAEASYVSIDLEMSGVRVKKAASRGKPSLQQAYLDAKEAAETFQILQIGLTSIQYDEQESKFPVGPKRARRKWLRTLTLIQESYLSKSFNFHLTPMFLESGGAELALARILDRKVSFSYNSLLFLQRHGFRLEDSFAGGVPYLSRAECRDAVQQFLRPGRKAARDMIDLSIQDQATQEFYQDAQEQIRWWLDHPQEGDYVNIENPHGGRLNGFQIRLLYQLIEAEFETQLRGLMKEGSFMQIVKPDTAREEKFWSQKKEESADALRKQAGFSIVFEALTGGNFAQNINVQWLIGDLNEPTRTGAARRMKQTLEDYESKIKRRRPIFVGHNQFMDLCFIYRTFIGPLPGSLRDFQRDIQACFPRMIDTKYMVTRGRHNMLADGNLEEWFTSIKDQDAPRFMQSPLFGYMRRAAHEAGYDSYMTAVLFVKMSWKISRDPKNFKHIEGEDSDPNTDNDSEFFSASEGSLASPPAQGALPLHQQRPLYDEALRRFGSMWQIAGQSRNPPSPSPSPPKSSTTLSCRSESSGSLLDDDDDSDCFLHYKPLQPLRLVNGCLVEGSDEIEVDSARAKVPDWDTVFFKKFGNKIRVGNAGTLVFGRKQS